MERTSPTAAKGSTARKLMISVICAFAYPVLVWYVWYRVVGYGSATLVLAQIAGVVLAVALVVSLRIGFRRAGLSAAKLPPALAAGASAYATAMGLAVLVQSVGLADLQVMRPQYRLDAFLSSWGLTAFGEELLFAGVIFTLVRQLLEHRPGENRRAWLAVPVVAMLFALWHLPGYTAVGYTDGALIGRLGLNLVSWLVFGTIYLLSGNLWLVVIAHASTDYGITPLITNEPLFGLIFMAVLVLAAWRTKAAG